MIPNAPPSLQATRKTGLGLAARGEAAKKGERAEAVHRYRPPVPPAKESSMNVRRESEPSVSQLRVSASAACIVAVSPAPLEAAKIENPR